MALHQGAVSSASPLRLLQCPRSHFFTPFPCSTWAVQRLGSTSSPEGQASSFPAQEASPDFARAVWGLGSVEGPFQHSSSDSLSPQDRLALHKTWGVRVGHRSACALGEQSQMELHGMTSVTQQRPTARLFLTKNKK